MKRWLLVLVIGMLPIHFAFASDLGKKVWNHGSEDCTRNRDPAIEVFRFDATTYILRQNKCLHFEAPFIYVLFGKHTAFVQDTGASAGLARIPTDSLSTMLYGVSLLSGPIIRRARNRAFSSLIRTVTVTTRQETRSFEASPT